MLRLAVSLCSVLLVLLALEAYLRLSERMPESAHALYSFHDSDPLIGWIGKRNLRQRFLSRDFDVVVEHDAEGFRRPDPALPAEPTRSILVLGDSFTWGAGVGQGEIFTDHLQRRLGPDVAVVNRGLNGIGTGQEYLLLTRELARRRYDLVLLQFTPNDIDDNVDDKEGRRPVFAVRDGQLVATNPELRPLMGPLRSFLKTHSHAFNLISFRWNLLDRRFQTERRKTRSESRDEDLRALPGFEVTVHLLRAMDALARENGAGFRLVSANPDAPLIEAALDELCARSGVAEIDLTPALAAQPELDLTFASNRHWTPDGHRAVADALLDAPEIVAWLGESALSARAVVGRVEGPAPAHR